MGADAVRQLLANAQLEELDLVHGQLGRLLVRWFNPLAHELLPSAQVLRASLAGTFGAGTVEQVRRIAHGVGLNGSVLALWPFEGAGVIGNSETIIDHIEDLWAPSSDDLLLVSVDNRVLLRIDHEEEVVGYRF